MKTNLEKLCHALFFSLACVAVLAVVTICVFLFSEGIPTIAKIGAKDFLFGGEWGPSAGQFGVGRMILGSLAVTLYSSLVGVPIGVLSAVFLVFFAPSWIGRIFRSAVELLAGIPSIVFGFFGLSVLVPMIRRAFGGSGYSVLATALLLAVMMLPGVISISADALLAAPKSYYEGARALGAGKESAVFSVVLPAARSGISAAVTLGIGRAIGESMAVVMIAGNQVLAPSRLLMGTRTLTANIVLEMGYAQGLHADALIATGVVLFVMVICNLGAVAWIKRWGRKR